MRVLVACDRCKRQYDASGRPPGAKLHCACGQVLTVETKQGHDAAVVRCSACGAPREAQESECGYCGSSFTLHERDRNTICPHCLARVSDSARFCHHCASPIVPEDDAGAESDHTCPVCGDEHRLTSRELGDAELPIFECGRCAGLWLGSDVFRRLEERARSSSLPVQATADAAGPPRSVPAAAQEGPLYRPCPVCGNLMHRHNYGRRSGVIIDSCKDHGLWFDDHELTRILSWIREGGLGAAQQRDQEERTTQQRIETLSLPDTGWRPSEVRPYGGGETDFLWEIGRFLAGMLRR